MKLCVSLNLAASLPSALRRGLGARCVQGLLLVLCAAASLRVEAQLRFVTVVPAAANTSFPDEDGEYPAYIEIRSLETGILSGHFLSDQPNVPNKWQVPGGYVLTSGQSMRIFASGKDRKPAGPGGILHTSFTYDCSVPYCGLFNAQQALVHTFADRVDRCGCKGLLLLGPKAVARTWISTQPLGPEWVLPGFDDKEWIRGTTGVGYELGSSPYGTGLVLYHTMDKLDRVDPTIKDVSGPIVHNGTLAGALNTAPGQIAEGLEFKGEPTSFVRVPHHSELDPGTGSFTVSLWFRALRSGGTAATVVPNFTEVLVSKQAAPASTAQAGGGWSIYRNQNGAFVQTISSAGTRTVALGQTSAGVWHHVVLVVNRTGSQLIGYLNGKRIGVAALAALSPELIGSAADLIQGRDLAGIAPYIGRLDDLAIWSRALSDAQVTEVFSAGQKNKSFMDASLFALAGKLYSGLIGTDVLGKMKGISASAYIRVPFNISSLPALATGLKLRVQYDDGFVAYLNGVEVARRNAPVILDDLATAEKDRPDAAALAAETIDLTAYIGLLRPGGNVLAFQALNSDANAERFLLNPAQLCFEVDRTTTGTGECIKETNGLNFWVAFPQNYAQEPDTPLRLSLCIAGPPQTVGAIEIPGLNLSGFPRTFVIPASGAVTIPIPSAAELSGPDRIEGKGVHIVASANVAVYGTSRMDYTTDSFLALPFKCLGMEYLISSYKNVFNGIPILNGSQFAIVAVANNTIVTVIPSQNVGTHLAKQPYVIQLNRGETYQLRNEAGQPADLTGTQILASKPIGVFGSHRCANVQSVNQFFCDTVLEQLLPVSSWGSSFFVVPLATRKSDTVRVLSGGNDNLVTVASSSGSQGFTLQSGEFKDLTLDSPTRVSCRQRSTVMQFANSSDFDHVTDADPFMAMIQPITSWLSEYRFCTPPLADFENNYINLVATTQATLDNTLINGKFVSAWNPADIDKGSLPSGAVFARVRLEPRTAYLVDARSPIGLTVYGFSEYDSYGYPGGMRFGDTLPPIITCPQELTISCQSVPGAAGCLAAVPDLTLKSDFFDDCTPEGQLVVNQTPKPGELLNPGTYSVKITAADAKGNQAECTVKLVIEPGWAQQQFGPAIASNPSLQASIWGGSADPDQDGLPNDLEQAVGSDPNKATSLLNIVQLITAEEQNSSFLMVSVPRLLGPGPAVELEGVAALDGAPWLSGPDIFEELPAKATPLPGGKYERGVFKVRHTESNGRTQSYFIRFRSKP
jgi:hypothetical protein